MIQIWPNMAASQICMRYGLHGPSLTVTTACASSLDALGTAARFLQSGLADVAVTGGIEGAYAQGPDGFDGYVPATTAGGKGYGMSTASVDPLRSMLPFDAHRGGIVSGEGAAFFVLETEDHARARGAEVLAWVRGYGSLSDGHHPSSPEPIGRWEARAMALAQADAGITAGDVDALVAHATGTPKGDDAEIAALNRVFVDGAGRADLPVTLAQGPHRAHRGLGRGPWASWPACGPCTTAASPTSPAPRCPTPPSASTSSSTSPAPSTSRSCRSMRSASAARTPRSWSPGTDGVSLRPPASVPPDYTFADCVGARAATQPDRVAIEVLDPRVSGTTPVETWTYDQVWRRVAGPGRHPR